MSTSMLLQLIDATNRFRAGWQEGQPPRIEDFLDNLGKEDRRSLLLELLGLEIDFRLQRGESPDREAYRARFPDDLGVVDAIWAEAGLDFATDLYVPSSPLGTLIPDGVNGRIGTTAQAEESTRRFKSPEVIVSLVPASVGRYRVNSILGDGGYGRVYLGFDGELNRPVAIKVPHLRRVSRSGDIESYLAEAQIVASLDHHGIVPVYDFGRTDDGLCFMVSKFLDGGDLSKKIRLEPLPHETAASLLAEVTEAVEHAHTHGLVHRDIKPRNLLLDHAGRAYLADFGAASAMLTTGPGRASRELLTI